MNEHTTDVIKILPCPFCGQPAGLVETYEDLAKKVACQACDSCGPSALTNPGAILLWNLAKRG